MNFIKNFYFNPYEIDSEEFENRLIVNILFTVLILVALLAWITHLTQLYINNEFTLEFGFFIFTSAIMLFVLEHTFQISQRKHTIIDVALLVLLSIFVLRYYHVFGPSVWTASFDLIIIQLVREKKNPMILYALVIFALGIYISATQMPFEYNRDYFVSQFLAFSILFLLTLVIYSLNKKKNDLIREKNKNIENYANRLSEQIDENKKIYEELKSSELRSRVILEAMPDAILQIEPDVSIRHVAGNTHLIYKIFSEEHMINKNLADYIIFNQKSELDILVAKAIETKRVIVAEGTTSDNDKIVECRINCIDENSIYVIIRDVTQLRKHIEKIEYLSMRDQLTGLYNRRFFEAEYRRHDNQRFYPLSVVVIDINGLKMVNDVFGHLVGDELIRQITKAITKTSRKSEIIARLGGDEFYLLLPNTNLAGAKVVAERIIENVKLISINPIVPSISYGYATKEDETVSIDSLISVADEMMYCRKAFESELMRNNTLKLIMHSIFEKNHSQLAHFNNVKAFSKAIALAMNLDNSVSEMVELAAFHHDIGKVEVEINKNTEKSDGKKGSIVRKHSEIGYQILKSISNYAPIAEFVLYHHENWDGTGYPKGLKGKEIPLVSRIISVANAYDLLDNNQSYQGKPGKNDIINELELGSGTLFDPDIVCIAVKIINEGKYNPTKIND